MAGGWQVEADQRERLLAAARQLGPGNFNKLVRSVDDVRARGRLRFWQEQLVAGLPAPGISGPGDFIAMFSGAELLPEPVPVITKEEFFARPNYWYYLGGAPIPDGWIAEAWEQLPEFRDNVTYEFEREASKIGDISGLTTSLEFLDRILPLHRMVEIYERVRDRSPTRELEFRPTFERIFGERMRAFPEPLPPKDWGEPHYPYGVPDGPSNDDEIPF